MADRWSQQCFAQYYLCLCFGVVLAILVEEQREENRSKIGTGSGVEKPQALYQAASAFPVASFLNWCCCSASSFPLCLMIIFQLL